ncbi:M23 family metallopeptidase [Actinoplanes solisilvae]|uniref:M23 family metallopeptidase n=1 Tax=Actinoplanes solisilvae TaxID=2486853 RepID=UPI000FDA54E1|nr:M23 family metallopeptidase [Actinoplanes solisilvae]
MPHRTETRSAGRHRRGQAGRHRAFRPLSSNRVRAGLLTVGLGAALATGVAGGTAAADAAADKRAVSFIVPAEPPPAPDGRPAAVGPWKPAEGTAVASARRLKSRPTVAPKVAPVVEGWVNPNPSGRVTSCYGERWGRLHAGVDIAGSAGSPILAAGNGVVVRAGEAQGYGLAVLIDHGNGYLTHYGHMSAIAVRDGQRVVAGEQIGDEGSTGHSTGPHLHFEVHLGAYKNPVEPTTWLRDRGVTVVGC